MIGNETANGSGDGVASREDLDGVRGKLFRADVDRRQFELLKETVFDPKTDEGRSRHTVYWTAQTQFVRVDQQNSFAGIEGEKLVHISKLRGDNIELAAKCEPFVCLQVTVLAPGEDVSVWPAGERAVAGPFTADSDSDKHRAGTIMLQGKTVPMRLRGPRAQVDVRSIVNEDQLRDGFWETRIFGQRDQAGRFVASRIDLYPRVDPRTADDPNLPRVLVIGDSISMNYHEAAKEALKGIANYHRIDGNGGPSDRGVACTELWLGDYQQPGLHWDLIQFNHGLHDLKQLYDRETETYGKYQVPIEQYQANLEKEIAIMRKTGATLMWCTTTPIPSSSTGVWGNVWMGRKEGADTIFNKAAMQVMARHPDILINDLNAAIRGSDGFEKWWEGSDVHFWGRPQQQIVGQAVADAIKKALKHREKTQAED